MSVAGSKKIIKDGQVVKGLFLQFDSDDNSVRLEDLPSGTQKRVEFKARFKVDGKTVERKIVVYSKTFKGALKEAISKREDLINQLRNGTLKKARERKITLDEAMREYLEFKKPSLKPRTFEYYAQTYNKWIKPKLGKRVLKTITTNDLQSIVNSMLKDGVAPRTAHSIKQVTRPLFKYFIDKGILKGNPASLLQLPKYDNTVQLSLTEDEIKSLYKAINEYPIEPFRTLFMWLSEGRRLNELLSLEWKNIDFENGYYTIESDKNKAGVSMRYRLRESIKNNLIEIHKINKSKYVFHAMNDNAKPMSKETVRGHWKRLLKNAEIEHLRIHDLRHIIGTELVSNNYTLEEIAQVLGHTSTSVTKRYSKVREKVANEALDSFFERVNFKE